MSPPPSRPIPMRAAAFDGKAAWLHEAAGRRGVVIAGSIGFEALTSHRFLRILADRLAAAGWPCLRFDWRGTGDSAGEMDVSGWAADLDGAIDHLKAETGVSDVLLIGFRLGTLLAASVAARRDDVSGLALLAPPLSGRAFGRELAGLSRLIDGTLEAPAEIEPFDGIHAAGFAYAKETLTGISALTWPSAASRTCPLDRLILAQAGASPKILPDGLSGHASQDIFAGYAEMMCDPTAGEVALAALDRVVAWVGPASLVNPALPLHEPPIRDRTLFGDGWIEEAVTFGPEDRLAGIWCRPSARQPDSAVIFTNSGAISHVGWGRMTVDHARLLARHGIASLRMDFAEMGDSTDATSGPRLNLYDSEPQTDIVAALDWLEAREIRDITLTGICAGAHQSFHAALRDTRVTGLVSVNMLCFIWGPSYALGLNVWKHAKTTLAGASEGGRPTLLGQILARVKKPAARALRSLIQMMQSDPGRRLLARITGRRLPSRVEGMIRALARRGARIAFVSVTSDGSLAEIGRHLGPEGEAIADLEIGFHVIANTDHTLTPPHARARLGEILLDFVRNGGTANRDTLQNDQRAA